MERYALPLEKVKLKPNTCVEFKNDNKLGLRMKTAASGGGIYIEHEQSLSSLGLEHHYLTLNVYHECHDVLVVILSFKDYQERKISVHYGILPNVKTTICLPLSALNGEKLFLERYPGVMQSVLRGDAFVDKDKILYFEIATIASVVERECIISDVCVLSAEPAFTYSATPYIDELGQLLRKDWVGKTKNKHQLAEKLQQEWESMQRIETASPELSSYGGWKEQRFAATGYFRTEYDGRNWWFVDPQGYALFSTGMDCVHPSVAMKVEGMEHLLPNLPEKHGKFAESWDNEGYHFGIANLIVGFGEQWREKWRQLTEYRLKSWGINTIGNWSDNQFIAQSSLPYVYPMHSFPTTKKTIFRDFPDVFSDEYEAEAKSFAQQLASFKDDKRLIGYFLRNEPHWAFVDGVNLTEQMLRSNEPFKSKIAFVSWITDKYKSIDALNEAWGSSFTTFEDLYNPSIIANFLATGQCPADFQLFNRRMIRRYVELPSQQCKLVDPHHLNLGMRYAWISNDELLEGCENFDVFSINCYDMAPNKEQIQFISERLHKPVMIGEFHFGAADSGMLAYGIRAVSTQEERGMAYQYYVEQAAAIPELIGVHYFQLNDQPVLGRFDGENYGIGIVDVCQQPYQPFVEAMIQTHKRIYEIRTGKLLPSQQCPCEIPRTGF